MKQSLAYPAAARATPAQIQRLIILAGQVVITTPRNPRHATVYVSARLIREIDQLLREIGLDMDQARHAMNALQRADNRPERT